MLGLASTLAQTYTTYSSPTLTSDSSSITPVFVVLMLLCLAVIVFVLAAMWRVYAKAGKPGWNAIVPIYNIVVLMEIVGRPAWWTILYFASFIPFVGFIIAFVISIIVANDLSKSFGRGTGTTVLLVLLPFIGYPMLAWGAAKYHGPAAKNGGGTPTAPSAGVMPPQAPQAPQM